LGEVEQKTAMPKLLTVSIISLLLVASLLAQSNDDCFMCHEDHDLTKELDGRELSLFINLDIFTKSIHGEMECVDCHQDLVDAELPHEEELETVQCGICHDDIDDIYSGSLHGELVSQGARLAPKCSSCHGSHDIQSGSSPESRTNKFNIPFMCGYCHKEGTEVTQTYDIPEDSILSHYSQSIHGIGLYKQGLTVTAVCSDCHTAHNVRDHTDPKSSIFRDSIPITCQQCHGQIEKVHRKVIRGELWAKSPDIVPICIDCHPPHQIRQAYFDLGLSDKDCMECHNDPMLVSIQDGDTISMYVDSLDTRHSIHRQITCAQCHTDLSLEHERPCATVINKVDCSICHAEVVQTFAGGVHGKLFDRGDQSAPGCTTCHGTHAIKDKKNPKSETFPINVPTLCGECHKIGGKASVRIDDGERNIIEEYAISIHGKGLIGSGLVVTAMCTDCHTAHHVLPQADTASSVYRDNIPETCAKCHNGIYEKFTESIHSPEISNSDEQLPVCHDCHKSHEIARADVDDFKLEIMSQCGHCHEDVTESYFETFHGKVSKLGYTAAAKCYDCHGAHEILPTDNPHSTLSHQNIVETCGKCHPGSHRELIPY